MRAFTQLVLTSLDGAYCLYISVKSAVSSLLARTQKFSTALFTHGDLFLKLNGGDPFARRLKPRVRRRPKALHRCYRLLHAMRVHRWHAPVVRGRRCARRFLRALDAAGNGDAGGITDVYFGHTHTRFSNYRYRGLRFHNTGSLIGGLPWHLLAVTLGD